MMLLTGEVWTWIEIEELELSSIFGGDPVSLALSPEIAGLVYLLWLSRAWGAKGPVLGNMKWIDAKTTWQARVRGAAKLSSPQAAMADLWAKLKIDAGDLRREDQELRRTWCRAVATTWTRLRRDSIDEALSGVEVWAEWNKQIKEAQGRANSGRPAPSDSQAQDDWASNRPDLYLRMEMP